MVIPLPPQFEFVERCRTVVNVPFELYDFWATIGGQTRTGADIATHFLAGVQHFDDEMRDTGIRRLLPKYVRAVLHGEEHQKAVLEHMTI